MQSFGEYIKQYLQERDISYSIAARMCGIDRTVLGRYASGTRRPQNREMVLKLAEGLQMSLEAQKELCEAYRRSVISETYHTDYEIIASILGKHLAINKEKDNTSEYRTFPKESACSLYTQEEVIEALRFVINDAEFLKMKFNPSCFAMSKEFGNIFTDIRRECPVEHMITLEHFEWQYVEGKMQSLEQLLPFLFDEDNGTVYYYYQRESRTEEESVKQNYVITNQGIVFFNHNLSQGFFSNQKVPCSYYTMSFERMQGKCRIFAEGGAEQYIAFRQQSMNSCYADENSGIAFYDQQDRNCLWLVKDAQKTAVCIREIEIVQLLRTFIWSNEEDVG